MLSAGPVHKILNAYWPVAVFLLPTESCLIQEKGAASLRRRSPQVSSAHFATSAAFNVPLLCFPAARLGLSVFRLG